jgi:hypothetical protein
MYTDTQRHISLHKQVPDLEDILIYIHTYTGTTSYEGCQCIPGYYKDHILQHVDEEQNVICTVMHGTHESPCVQCPVNSVQGESVIRVTYARCSSPWWLGLWHWDASPLHESVMMMIETPFCRFFCLSVWLSVHRLSVCLCHFFSVFYPSVYVRACHACWSRHVNMHVHLVRTFKLRMCVYLWELRIHIHTTNPSQMSGTL